MSKQARIFATGGSQAVRLPAEFRFDDVDKVYVRRNAAGEVVLSARPPPSYPRIRADQFVDRDGRRVLTDDGSPGRDGREGIGSTTEQMQGRVAAAIYANCEELNSAQLDEIVAWVNQYKSDR